MRRAAKTRELGDGALDDLGGYLDDLDRFNRWFGGYRLPARAVAALVRESARRPPIVVDVGGARGDFAQRLVRDARAAGRPIVVVVADRDEPSLVMGARAAKANAEIRWVQADATALPLRAGAVDVVVTSLTMHHLEPEDVVRALGEMRAAARLGVVVNDLFRSWIAWASVRACTRLVGRHPASRHDGPLSVRRAYTPRELLALAARAGFARFRVRRHWPLLRLVGVGR